MRGAQLQATSQAAGWPWWHRCSLPVALGHESLLSWHNQECTELVGMMEEKSGWNWPRSSAFGPTKPFPCPVVPAAAPESWSEQLAGASQDSWLLWPLTDTVTR